MRYLISVSALLLSISFARGQNLISNSSFESGGQLDCMSWYDACAQELTYLCDSTISSNPCDVRFEPDAPAAGGIWCVVVTGIGNSAASTASTYISGQDGTHSYLLRAWMKDAGNAWGGVNIGIHSKGMYELHKTVRADSLDWALFTVYDTLTLEPTDSIEIMLWAFAAGPSFGDINFDEVEFFVLDTLSAVGEVDRDPLARVALFPNPAADDIHLNIQDQMQAHIISLYSLSGQLIQRLVTSDQLVTIDLTDWDHGLFFYRVERTGGKGTIGQGKFMVE